MPELLPFDPDLEFLSRDDLDAMQLAKLKAMLAHVAATNTFYQRLWSEAGVDIARIRSFEDFRAAIPFVEKSHFLADQTANPPFGTRLGSLITPGERADIYTTSGTSGQGVELHAQSKRELAVMEKMYGFHFCWAGLKPGDSVLLTVPITMLAGGRVEYQGAVGYDLTVLPVGNYDAARKVEILKRFRPKALYGSTSYYAHLATLLGEEARRSGIEVLLTGMEGAGFSFLKSLEVQWGAVAADRFGCAQMRADFLFTDEHGIGEPGKPGTLYNMDPFVYLEILDTATGKPVPDGEFGELVVTSLYHFDNPVIRNRLRDGAIFRKAGAHGGRRNFHGIEVASIGRIDDVKKVKGINLYPQAVDDLVFSVPEIEQYEVVISQTPSFADVATLNVTLRQPLDADGRDRFVARLGQLVKARMGINFEINVVEEIAVSDYKARRWKDLRQR